MMIRLGRITRTAIVIMAIILGLSFNMGYAAPSFAGSDSSSIDRMFGELNHVKYAGDNRYETALKTADALKKSLDVDKFENIVVACGSNYPDALTGSYLAKVKNAPILLVDKSVETEIAEYIFANLSNEGKVYILGGTGAISSNFEKGLAKKVSVKRLAGADRYKTNIAILKECNVTNEDMLICTGTGFADSLSASAAGKPIMLVGSKLSADQKAYLNTLGTSKYYLIGGTGVVSKGIANEIAKYGTVKRVAGADRYATSVEVAKTFFKDSKTVVLAYGQNFPDGLSGAPLALSLGAPLVLTSNDVKASNTTSAYTKNTMGATHAVSLGGEGLVSEATALKHITKAEKPEEPPVVPDEPVVPDDPYEDGYIDYSKDGSTTNTTRLYIGQEWTDELNAKLNNGKAVEKLLTRSHPKHFLGGDEDIYCYDTVDFDNFLIVYVKDGKVIAWQTNAKVLGVYEGIVIRNNVPTSTYADYDKWMESWDGGPMLWEATVKSYNVPIGNIYFGGIIESTSVWDNHCSSDLKGEEILCEYTINALRVLNGRTILEHNDYLYGDEDVYGAKAWSKTMAMSDTMSHGELPTGPLAGLDMTTRHGLSYEYSDGVVLSCNENVANGGCGEGVANMWYRSVGHSQALMATNDMGSKYEPTSIMAAAVYPSADGTKEY
ncbi:MAG: cell wall-binding repeat-containing protein, partial [Firmicutes bacterium]|nr:cell wall-binding repeat-containing protein [Bacillota bacterium]